MTTLQLRIRICVCLSAFLWFISGSNAQNRTDSVIIQIKLTHEGKKANACFFQVRVIDNSRKVVFRTSSNMEGKFKIPRPFANEHYRIRIAKRSFKVQQDFYVDLQPNLSSYSFVHQSEYAQLINCEEATDDLEEEFRKLSEKYSIMEEKYWLLQNRLLQIEGTYTGKMVELERTNKILGDSIANLSRELKKKISNIQELEQKYEKELAKKGHLQQQIDDLEENNRILQKQFENLEKRVKQLKKEFKFPIIKEFSWKPSPFKGNPRRVKREELYYIRPECEFVDIRLLKSYGYSIDIHFDINGEPDPDRITNVKGKFAHTKGNVAFWSPIIIQDYLEEEQIRRLSRITVFLFVKPNGLETKFQIGEMVYEVRRGLLTKRTG